MTPRSSSSQHHSMERRLQWSNLAASSTCPRDKGCTHASPSIPPNRQMYRQDTALAQSFQQCSRIRPGRALAQSCPLKDNRRPIDRFHSPRHFCLPRPFDRCQLGTESASLTWSQVDSNSRDRNNLTWLVGRSSRHTSLPQSIGNRFPSCAPWLGCKCPQGRQLLMWRHAGSNGLSHSRDLRCSARPRGRCRRPRDRHPANQCC